MASDVACGVPEVGEDMTEKEDEVYTPPICIVCTKPLEGGKWQESSVEFIGSPGFGSKYDCSLLAEEALVIAVCDECLAQHKDAVVLCKTEVKKSMQCCEWSPDYDAFRTQNEALDRAVRADKAKKGTS